MDFQLTINSHYTQQREMLDGAHFDHVEDVDHGESVRIRLLTVLMFVEPRSWDESTDHAG